MRTMELAWMLAALAGLAGCGGGRPEPPPPNTVCAPEALPPQPLSADCRLLNVELVALAGGGARYRVAGETVDGEAALAARVSALVAEARGDGKQVMVNLSVTPGAGVTGKHVKAAKQVCLEAGALLLERPMPPMGDEYLFDAPEAPRPAGAEPPPAPPKDGPPASRGPEVRFQTVEIVSVVLAVDKAGAAGYELDKVGYKDAAALTAELRKKLADLKKTADSVAVRLVVFDFANVTQEALKTAEGACRDAGAELFDAPITRLRKSEPLVTDSIYTVWMGADKGKVKYLLGTWLLEGEAELAAAVKPLAAGKKGGEVCLVFETLDFAHITEKELAAAKAAVEAAGARVEKLPELPKVDPMLRRHMRSEGRHANADVKGVGVRDGVLQFRLGDRLVEGEAALTEALRQRIAEIEKEKGGFTLITPGWEAVPELEISPAQTEAVWKAIKSAVTDPEGFFGYRYGGRRRMTVSGRGWSFPVITFVKVNIVAPVEGGNRYLLGEQTVDGEKALTAALKKTLADSRRGQDNAEGCFLSIKLAAEVKPGITATEEQIERARATVKAARLEAPPLQHVAIKVTAPGKYAVGESAVDGDAALIAKIKELATAAGQSGRMLQMSVEMAEGASVPDDTSKALRKACLDAGAAVRAAGPSADKEKTP